MIESLPGCVFVYPVIDSLMKGFVKFTVHIRRNKRAVLGSKIGATDINDVNFITNCFMGKLQVFQCYFTLQFKDSLDIIGIFNMSHNPFFWISDTFGMFYSRAWYLRDISKTGINKFSNDAKIAILI